MTCPIEAVLGPGDENAYPCTYAEGHEPPHSWEYPNTNPPSVADLSYRWIHLGCGGRVYWDHSGGFCYGCEEEGLAESDAEKRELCPACGGKGFAGDIPPKLRTAES